MRMRRATGVAALVCLAVLATAAIVTGGGGSPPPSAAPHAPTARPDTPAATSPPARDLRLVRRRVTDLLADELLRLDASVAVAVIDEAGRTVVDRDADRMLLPASTQKLPVAAAALRLLGPDFRYVTRAAATGPLQADGTLAADLVLVGSGDPALGTPTFGRLLYPDRPRTPLEELADDLVAAGVTGVQGRVVGDATAFAQRPLAAGWKAAYLEDLDARRVSALTVDGGLHYDLHGDDLDTLEVEAAADPALEAARALGDLLEQRGVTVVGAPTVARRPPQPRRLLAAVRSPPLADLLEHTLQHSDNHMADAIFRTLAPAGGDRDWAAGAAAARRALRSLGIDARGTVLADGSGLSRDDRLSAGLLARLDRTMAGLAGELPWRRLQAVAGRDGTLRRWLVGTVAAGRFAGKSGSLDDVRAVAGSVRGPDGRRYHLGVIVNDLATEDVGRARVLMQVLVLGLAADLYRCEPPRVVSGRLAGRPGIVPGGCPPSVAATGEVLR